MRQVSCHMSGWNAERGCHRSQSGVAPLPFVHLHLQVNPPTHTGTTCLSSTADQEMSGGQLPIGYTEFPCP